MDADYFPEQIGEGGKVTATLDNMKGTHSEAQRRLKKNGWRKELNRGPRGNSPDRKKDSTGTEKMNQKVDVNDNKVEAPSSKTQSSRLSGPDPGAGQSMKQASSFK